MSWIGVEQAAKIIGVSLPTIYRFARSGKLPAQKIGRSWRFARTDLERYCSPTVLNLHTASLSNDEIAELFHLTQEQDGIGVWQFEVSTSKITWSPEVYRIHEMPEGSEPDFEGAIAHFSPESRVLLLSAMELALTSGKSFNLELSLTTAHGRERRVRVLANVKVADGIVTKLFGTFQDISDKQDIANLRRNTEARLKNVLDDLLDGYWIWSILNGELHLSTKLWGQLAAQSQALSPNFDFYKQRIHPDDLKTFNEKLESHLSETSPLFEMEHRLKTRDTSYIWYQVRGKVIDRNIHGAPLRMLACFQNIETKKELERYQSNLAARFIESVEDDLTEKEIGLTLRQNLEVAAGLMEKLSQQKNLKT